MGFVAYAQGLICFASMYLFFLVRYGVHDAMTDMCHRGRGRGEVCGISIVQAGLNMDNQLP